MNPVGVRFLAMDEDKVKAAIAQWKEGHIPCGEFEYLLRDAGVPEYLTSFVSHMHGRNMAVLQAERGGVYGKGGRKKLVRDKIPDLMKAEGKEVETFECTTDPMYWGFLADKLIEEALELHAHGGVGYGDVDGFKEPEEDVNAALEELADVSETLMALRMEAHRRFPGKLEVIGENKREAKGTFTRTGLVFPKRTT